MQAYTRVKLPHFQSWAVCKFAGLEFWEFHLFVIMSELILNSIVTKYDVDQYSNCILSKLSKIVTKMLA